MNKYQPVSKSNLSEQIAEYIERSIMSHELKAGDRLPSEVALAEKFGASRNAVREAIRTLKARGLVSVKSGSGTFIAQMDPLVLQPVLNRIYTLGNITPHEVFAVRRALEVTACAMAAENADKTHIKALREIIKRMKRDLDDHSLWMAHDRQFHFRIAEMTKTTMFPAFIRPLVDIVSQIFGEFPPPVNARKRGLEQHIQIVEAMERRDVGCARQAMEEHLQIFLEDLVLIFNQSQRNGGDSKNDENN